MRIQELSGLCLQSKTLSLTSADLTGITKTDSTCVLHNKKLEAYCLYDKQLLCIDCILSDDHKSLQLAGLKGGPGRHERIIHEIISIEKAVKNERTALNDQLKLIENV